jgi:hypothetical protein
LLVPMRMAAEGLSAMDAVDAVLADNLHGLEIDARCVEIAVFALALAAWRFPDENGDPLGVRADMPAPQIACCGLKVAAKPEDWMALVPDDAPMRNCCGRNCGCCTPALRRRRCWAACWTRRGA